MLSESSVTYKAYLYEDGNESEIRKFTLDRDVATSFTHLKGKIANIFPSLSGKTNFTISWKDGEGDMITLGTDDELMIFLLEVSGLRKIYISLGDRSDINVEPNQQGATDGNIHSGVVCDGCNSGVMGFRYKCTTCPDFDLCSACESKGLHPEHFMLRVPVPFDVRNHHMGKKFCKGIQKSMRRQEKWNSRRHCFQRGDHHPTHEHPPWAQAAGVWVDTFAGVLHDTLETFGNFAQGLSQPEKQPGQPNRETQTPTATEATPMESETVPTPSPPEAVQNTNSESNTNNERGWVLVDEGSGKTLQTQPRSDHTQASPIEQATTSQQASAPPVQGTDNLPRNEKVEQALERMLAMGFNNEGGWLRQMLLYKDGNIGDVLDILLPMRKMTMQNN